jgi:4-hydroxy-3-methylbut-2-en-1-yl diphosphate reductase
VSELPTDPTAPRQPAAEAPQAAKRVLLAAPRGYCAGVDRAVVTVEKALEL